MEIYLDANATTPVLPEARAAALAVMGEVFGNPSSVHGSGLKARALLDEARAVARRVLGAASGQLLFTSGATEGIHTAVLSALTALRQGVRAAGPPPLLLYGATEHKAVPEALNHWNTVLGLDLPVQAIPVDSQGRHDLAWLRARLPRAGLVCTMAANNETGVVSDLDALADLLRDSPVLWLVDSVQALGKLDLRLVERRIDYATFSGHKLYAPKGIGMLVVRDGAPFTPLLTGGGQEGAWRAGTENMAGIAALGAVLALLEQGTRFAAPVVLAQHRALLMRALEDAFPGLVYNAPAALCLPTTLNFSVPGVAATQLLALFDTAGLRASGGSACSAAKALPSPVLEAMGLPAWQTTSAIRLSFGAADDRAHIDEACVRIRACGDALRRGAPQNLEVDAAALARCLRDAPPPLLVDVREPAEQRAAPAAPLGAGVAVLSVPSSVLAETLAGWDRLPPERPVLFFCRSGQRSAQAAAALRRLGHVRCWSLRGGLEAWPATPAPAALAA